MAGIQKEFPYNYNIDGSKSSIQNLDINQIWEVLKDNLSSNDDFKKIKTEKGKLIARYKHDQNIKFDCELEADKRRDKIDIRGSLKRGLTGWGTCLICSTAGFASFMIAQNYQKVSGDEPATMLDDALKRTETELEDIGLLDNKTSSTGEQDKGVQRLKERFAEGEIDEDEYRKRLNVLKDEPSKRDKTDKG